jgi:hypothetical protein
LWTSALLRHVAAHFCDMHCRANAWHRATRTSHMQPARPTHPTLEFDPLDQHRGALRKLRG